MSRADFFCPIDGNCKEDIFVNGLRNLFSPEYINSMIAGANNSLTTPADQNFEFPIQIITHSLAVVTTILIGLYLITVFYSRLVKGSQTGSALDEKDSIMSVVRPVYSLIAVFPVAYGYPLIVHFLLFVALASNGTANWIMQKFTKASFTLSSTFMFETVDDKGGKDGKYTYKTGDNIRSTGALRELNHLKEPALIGFQHGLCMKHWSENGLDVSPYFPRSSSYGAVPSGKVQVEFFDLSQRGWIEKFKDTAVSNSYFSWIKAGTSENVDMSDIRNEAKIHGSTNPVCGQFSVDFSTPSEVALSLNQSVKHTNKDIAVVKKEVNDYRKILAYRGALVNNVRNVYQISAYLMGLDYALGENPKRTLKSARDEMYASFGVMIDKSLNGTDRTKLVGLSKHNENLFNSITGNQPLIDGKSPRTIMDEHVNDLLRMMRGNSLAGSGSTMPFMMGKNIAGKTKKTGFKITDDENGRLIEEIDALFALVDGKLENTLDRAHYSILGNTTPSGQPKLDFLEKNIKDIEKKINQAVLAKGMFNAGNASTVAKQLNQSLNSNILTKTMEGKFYAMDMQTEYDKEDKTGVEESVEAINNTMSILNTRVQEYPQPYVGTGVKMYSMMNNNGSTAIRSADDGALQSFISGQMIGEMERYMLSPLLRERPMGFGGSQLIFDDLREVGENAFYASIPFEMMYRGFVVGATAMDGVTAVGSNPWQVVTNLAKILRDTVGVTATEMIDFLDNMHTFFSITMPMIGNMILILAGLGAYIQVVTVALAVVLYMVLHAKPEQTFVGTNIQLYLLFFNVFLRLPLIYSFFLIANVLLAVIIPIATEIWFNAKTDTLSMAGQEGFSAVLLSIAALKKTWYLLAGSLTAITYITYSLTQEAPESVASILNTNVYPVMGAMSTERFTAGLTNMVGGGGAGGYKKQAREEHRRFNQERTKANQDKANKQISDKEAEIKEMKRELADLVGGRGGKGSSLGGGGISNQERMQTLRDNIKQAEGEKEAMKQNLANHSGFGMFRPAKALSGTTDYGTTKEAFQRTTAPVSNAIKKGGRVLSNVTDKITGRKSGGSSNGSKASNPVKQWRPNKK